MHRTLLFSLALLFAADMPRALAQETPTPEARFQEAWYREVAEARFEEALSIYHELANDDQLPKKLRARALYRVGQCQTKLGDEAAGKRTLARVLKEFPDENDVAAEIRAQLAGETEEAFRFRSKVESLTSLLGEKDEKVRQTAIDELSKIGPRTTPMVAELLGSPDFYASQAAIGLLISFAESDDLARRTVEAALDSGDEIVRSNALRSIKGSDIRVFDARFLRIATDQRASGRERALAIRHISSIHEEDRDELLLQLAMDPDPEVRKATVQAHGSGTTSPERWALLQRAFQDSHLEVRRQAVRQASGPRTLPIERLRDVIPLLLDDDESIFSGALRIVDKTGQSRSTAKSTARSTARARTVRPGTARAGTSRTLRSRSSKPRFSFRDYPSSTLPAVWPEGEQGDQLINVLTSRLEAERNPRNWEPIASVLRQLGRSDCIPGLSKGLVSSDRDTARLSIDGLRTLGTTEALRAILSALASDDELRLPQEELCETLMTFTTPEQLALLAASWQKTGPCPSKSLDLLERLHQEQVWSAAPLARELLQSEEPGVPGAAARLLLATSAPEERAALVARLPTLSDDVGRGVAESLFESLDTTDLAELAPQIVSHPGSIQWEFLERVQELGPEQAAELLLPFLASETSEVRARALGLLEKRDNEVAARAAVSALKDPAEDVRMQALDTLGNLAATAHNAEVLECLQNESSFPLRVAAVRTLQQIAEPSSVAPLLELYSGLPPLETDTSPPEPSSRRASSKAQATQRAIASSLHRGIITCLAAIPGKAASEALESFVVDSNSHASIRTLALESRTQRGESGAIQVLQRALSDPDATLRWQAVSLAGDGYEVSLLGAITQRLRDPSARVREAARETIERLRFYVESERLAREVAAPPESSALTELLKLARHTSPAVRVAAIDALVVLQTPEARRAIEALRSDADLGVRQAAERALAP